ncbi:unnamed protein product [Agarophyton chilense]
MRPQSVQPTPYSARTLTSSQKQQVTNRIQLRLAFGHASAILAVGVLIHGALIDYSNLAPNAVVLLMCAIPLRTILSLTDHSIRQPTKQSGLNLALKAAVLFSSNALHILATRVSPLRFTRLIGCSAMDVSATWLEMTVNAKMPSIHPFAIPFSFVYSAADIYLAAIVAGTQPIVDIFYPFLTLRFVINLRLLLVCSYKIVRNEEMKRGTSQTKL